MPHSFLTRRQFGLSTASILGATGWPGAVRAEESLGAIAAAAGLTYGSAVSAKALASDPDFAEAVAQQARCVVAEGEMKLAAVEAVRGRRDYAGADAIATFAGRHDMRLRGHCLIWHEAMPAWLPSALKQENAAAILESHIRAMIGRYAGPAHSWDVVNEALKPGAPDAGLRPSVWYEALGAGYIDTAFTIARDCDTGVQLVYNDFGFEHEVDWQIEKRRLCLDLLAGLRKRNTPCDAFGIQAHLSATGRFDERKVSDFLSAIAGMGYRIIISELDVDDSGLPDDIAARDAAMASITERFLNVALATDAVTDVLTWGISDRHSWLNSAPYSRRKGRAPARPLPLDENLSPKPMWTAMARAFATHGARRSGDRR